MYKLISKQEESLSQVPESVLCCVSHLPRYKKVRKKKNLKFPGRVNSRKITTKGARLIAWQIFSELSSRGYTYKIA